MSYLDTYGVRDARREKIFKRAALAILLSLIAGTVLYFQFRNFREERPPKVFLDHLRSGDYKSAYSLWGCTDAKPCPQYAFDKFMEDWGPSSPMKNPAQARISDTMACDTGVITFIEAPRQPRIQLWVDRKNREIGFAPWHLKEVPPGFRPQLALFFWKIAQNCTPLIGP